MPAVLRHSANAQTLELDLGVRKVSRGRSGADGEHIANIAVNLGGWLDQPRLGA
jgi:hypothetical protein